MYFEEDTHYVRHEHGVLYRKLSCMSYRNIYILLDTEFDTLYIFLLIRTFAYISCKYSCNVFHYLYQDILFIRCFIFNMFNLEI